MKDDEENIDWKITVSDSFCTWEYILNMTEHQSISDVIHKIYEAFNLEYKEGTLKKYP